MRRSHPIRHRLKRLLALIALGLLVCGLRSASAQTTLGDPVKDLRSVLKAPCVDPSKRDRSLKERIQALDGLGDLCRALVLEEWRDRDQDQRLAAVDFPNRLALARRFENSVRDVLRQGDEVPCLAVFGMLAEIGTSVHGLGTRHGIARAFGPELAELSQQRNAGIAEAAARCLGQIDPEPDVAMTAFSRLLGADNPNQRLAAADGLLGWMRTTVQRTTGDRQPAGVEATRADLVTVGRAVIPLAARGLGTEDSEVRRRTAQAIACAAAALHDWALTVDSTEAIEDNTGFERRAHEQRAALRPLFFALADQSPALSHALMDADTQVRFWAGRALEDLSLPRILFLQAPVSAVHEEQPAPVGIVWQSNFHSAASPSWKPEELHSTVQALVAQLAAGDIQARRAALDTLESLGPEAAPATAALMAALADPDKFVRWAAARTLGRMAPLEEAVAPALAQLLTDADLDVRLAAVVALERLGSGATPAALDLRRTAGSSDAELRAAALHTLASIGGPEAYAAVPEVMSALADSDARVRETAARVLGKFGPEARDAVPVLRQALTDNSPDVRKAAGEALLNILRSRKE